jgi:hypothetical protein
MKESFLISLLVAATCACAIPIRPVPPAFPRDIFRLNDQQTTVFFALGEACFQGLESVECQTAMAAYAANFITSNQQPRRHRILLASAIQLGLNVNGETSPTGAPSHKIMRLKVHAKPEKVESATQP